MIFHQYLLDKMNEIKAFELFSGTRDPAPIDRRG